MNLGFSRKWERTRKASFPSLACQIFILHSIYTCPTSNLWYTSCAFWAIVILLHSGHAYNLYLNCNVKHTEIFPSTQNNIKPVLYLSCVHAYTILGNMCIYFTHSNLSHIGFLGLEMWIWLTWISHITHRMLLCLLGQEFHYTYRGNMSNQFILQVTLSICSVMVSARLLKHGY